MRMNVRLLCMAFMVRWFVYVVRYLGGNGLGAGLRLGVPTRYLRRGFMVPLRLAVSVRYLCHCI